jgi:hypothetical protein
MAQFHLLDPTYDEAHGGRVIAGGGASNNLYVLFKFFVTRSIHVFMK